MIGYLDVDPTVSDRLVESTAEMQQATARDEPGCGRCLGRGAAYGVTARTQRPGQRLQEQVWLRLHHQCQTAQARAPCVCDHVVPPRMTCTQAAYAHVVVRKNHRAAHDSGRFFSRTACTT